MPTPQEIEAEKQAKLQQELDQQRRDAEQQSRGATQDDGIFGFIKQFLQFLFGSFLGTDNDAPNERDEGEAPETPDTPEQRIALGAGVVGSRSIPEWTKFQETHRGEKVDFKSPVNGQAEVTSGFGHRKAPVLPNGKTGSGEHQGVDIGSRGPSASPDILAAADGIVIFSGQRSGYGNAVIIGHADGTTTLYGHMDGKKMPAMGTEVKQSQVIGEMGSTGNSNGPHVHFEVRKGNTAIPPVIDGVNVQMSAMLVGHELPRFPVSDAPNNGAPTVASVKPKPGQSVAG